MSQYDHLIKTTEKRLNNTAFVDGKVAPNHEVFYLPYNPALVRQWSANGMIKSYVQVDTNKWIATTRTGQKMEMFADPKDMPWAIGTQQ